MILTREFLIAIKTPTDMYRYIFEHNIVNIEFDQAVDFLKNNGQNLWSWWLNNQKGSELYVRANGSKITMNEKYQVFNPLTGMHIACDTKDDMKALVLDISQQIINTYKISVNQEISNENGDATWTLLHLDSPKVSF
jgi:hypothetical protein